MNVILNSIDDEGGINKISVDLSFYEIEEIGETCLITHKMDFDKYYEVMADFNYLHTLSNGFNLTKLN